MKLNRKNLEKCLNKIEYTIKGGHHNRFIFNHENKNTGIRVLDATLEVNCEVGIRCIFCFDYSTIKMIDKTTVSIGLDGAFFNLYNFDNLKQQNT